MKEKYRDFRTLNALIAGLGFFLAGLASWWPLGILPSPLAVGFGTLMGLVVFSDLRRKQKYPSIEYHFSADTDVGKEERRVIDRARRKANSKRQTMRVLSEATSVGRKFYVELDDRTRIPNKYKKHASIFPQETFNLPALAAAYLWFLNTLLKVGNLFSADYGRWAVSSWVSVGSMILATLVNSFLPNGIPLFIGYLAWLVGFILFTTEAFWRVGAETRIGEKRGYPPREQLHLGMSLLFGPTMVWLITIIFNPVLPLP